MTETQKAPIRHIVLVIFDTLRRDAVGCYGTPPPWGAIETPHLDGFARESVRFDRAYPESLPTLCARRAIYTGRRTYPFHNGDFRLKGDFVGSRRAGDRFPRTQPTLAEMSEAGGFAPGSSPTSTMSSSPRRTSGAAFDQWMFIRGQENDPARSGPVPSQEVIDYWVPRELQELRGRRRGSSSRPARTGF